MKKSARLWLVSSVALLMLGLTTWLAKTGELVLGEEYVLNFAYNLPEDLRLYFLGITLLGSIWILAVVLSILFIKNRLDIAIRVILAAGMCFVLVALFKEFVGRPRPGLLIDILQRELFVQGYGFPSGHTALATAIALVLGAYLPKKKRYIVGIWIGLVAISRLYLGVHAPLDIVGGFCIGLLSVICVLIVLPPTKSMSKIRVAKTRS